MRPKNYCDTHFTCGNIDDVRCVVDPSHVLSQGCPLCVWGQNIAWVINFVARYFIFVLLISRVDVVFLFSKLACGNKLAHFITQIFLSFVPATVLKNILKATPQDCPSVVLCHMACLYM